MKTRLSITCATIALAAGMAAGCDASQSGANGVVSFTPTNCGLVGGCDFTDSVAAGGLINVQIAGIDGASTAGVDLASRDADLLAVEPAGDINGKPAWQLTALAAGVAELVAVRNGEELDFVEVPIQAPERLGLNGFFGDPVGPSAEADYDEGWTVNAGTQVSFYVTPRIGDNVEIMGRFTYETLTPDATLLATEVEGSDRPNGYIYVQPAPGDYPISFDLTINPDVKVDAIIHALPPPPS